MKNKITQGACKSHELNSNKRINSSIMPHMIIQLFHVMTDDTIRKFRIERIIFVLRKLLEQLKFVRQSMNIPFFSLIRTAVLLNQVFSISQARIKLLAIKIIEPMFRAGCHLQIFSFHLGSSNVWRYLSTISSFYALYREYFDWL